MPRRSDHTATRNSDDPSRKPCADAAQLLRGGAVLSDALSGARHPVSAFLIWNADCCTNIAAPGFRADPAMEATR
ncbi:MAG: hypothetical protein R3C45_16145 [Phycisphaerales bacterium]